MVNRLRQFGVAAAAGLALILWAGLTSATMPKNVILMISDGQGYNAVKATDYWTGSPAVYESFPVQYGMSTFSAGTPATPAWGYDPHQAWRDFTYVQQRYTDSAAGATAMATGVKIYDNVLNIDTAGDRLKPITECAQDLGSGTLPVAGYNSRNHSNSLVPLYAIGAGADLLAGYADQLDPGLAIYGLANFAYVDNTELFQVMNGAAVSLPGALRRPGSGLANLGLLHRRSPGQPH